MKMRIVALFLSLFLTVAQGGQDVACPSGVLEWAQRQLQRLFPPPPKLPSTAEVAEAKDLLSSTLNIKMVSLDHGRSGGMHVVFMGQGAQRIPPHPSIPRDLWNRPISDYVFKVTKRGSDPMVVARESVVEKELTEILGTRQKSKIRNIPSREIFLPDGTRLVIQEKALGQKPLKVIEEHFLGIFTEAPSNTELIDFLSLLSADDHIFKYFGENHGGLGPVEIRDIEGLLEDLHVNPELLKAHLKRPDIQNLISTLHDLRELSEGKDLPKSRISTSQIASRNRAFYKNDVTLNGALDMSVDNFHIQRFGDKFLINIFDK